MKKKLLLSFCLLCAYSVSGCSGTQETGARGNVFVDDAPVIDATVNPYDRCGVNGISCNDTALTNYTKTEADYRAYGERTRKDHLYTQAAAGNNLTATVRPDVEEDVVSERVVVRDTIRPNTPKKYVVDDGVFSKTGTMDVESHPSDYQTAKTVLQQTKPNEIKRNDKVIVKKEDTTPKNELGHAKNIKLTTVEKTITEEPGPSYEIVCANENCTEVKKIKKRVTQNGITYESVCIDDDCSEVKNIKKSKGGNMEYEIVCEEECDDILADDDQSITSEFTEESFDIADYIDMGDDDEIKFNEIGSTGELTADIDINEIKISDETILTWEAEEGENLRELLMKWSSMAGWKLLWNTNRNYILNAGVMFKGKFADVSSALIRAFARARPAPIATYYKGNRVIVVETMENENAY